MADYFRRNMKDFTLRFKIREQNYSFFRNKERKLKKKAQKRSKMRYFRLKMR